MQYKAYKIFYIVALLLTTNPTKAQVYGGDFYINYDRFNLKMVAYGIDNNKVENNQIIKVKLTKLNNTIYDKLNFISFQDTTENRERQYYETIVLKINAKKNKQKEMLIFITGRFWDILNYTLDIDFKRGVYSIFIPTTQNSQLKLKKCDLVRGCTSVTELLVKM